MTTKVHVGKLDIPEGIHVELDGNLLIARGVKGELRRNFVNPRIIISRENNFLNIRCRDKLKFSRRDKMFINSYRAHIKNIFKGVSVGYTAKLKICSGHFPMNVSVSGDTLQIKNFLGEKTPRVARIMSSTKVEVKGDEVLVSGIDKELVGQMAARVEQTTRITNRDRRVFQDGCFIVSKPGDDDG